MLFLTACAAAQGGTAVPPTEMALSSSAFAEGADIPARYTCQGADISPPLAWQNVPADTQSFALIMEDPDAPLGTWVHWVLFNIPADQTGLDEALPTDARLPDGSQQGLNSWGQTGYGGPCPPSGTHHYYFTLYALDTLLPAEPGLTADGLREQMRGHILAEAQWMGVFSK